MAQAYTYWAQNLSWDGSHWNCDDTLKAGVLLQMSASGWTFYTCGPASNPQTLSAGATISKAGLLLDTGSAPAASQLRIQAAGLGMLSALAYAADNIQTGWDCHWDGALGKYIADDATCMLLQKGGGALGIYRASGQTVGTAVGTTGTGWILGESMDLTTGLWTFASPMVIDAGAAPGDAQIQLGAAGVGSAWLSYTPDNVQWMAGCVWTGGQLIAKSATTFRIRKAGGAGGVVEFWAGHGQTVGNVVTDAVVATLDLATGVWTGSFPSNATQVNGAAVPASVNIAATNASSQIIACLIAGIGTPSVPVTVPPGKSLTVVAGLITGYF